MFLSHYRGTGAISASEMACSKALSLPGLDNGVRSNPPSTPETQFPGRKQARVLHPPPARSLNPHLCPQFALCSTQNELIRNHERPQGKTPTTRGEGQHVSGTGSLKKSFRNVSLQHKATKGKEFSCLPKEESLELETPTSPAGSLASLLLGKGGWFMDERRDTEQPASQVSRKLIFCSKVANLGCLERARFWK